MPRVTFRDISTSKEGSYLASDYTLPDGLKNGDNITCSPLPGTTVPHPHAIYLLENNQKRRYPSKKIYNSWDSSHKYTIILCKTLESIPDGPDMQMKSSSGPTGSTENPGNTGNTGTTENSANPGSTGPTENPTNPLGNSSNSSASGTPWWEWLLILGGILLLLILIGVGIYFVIRHHKSKSKKE